MSSKLTPCANSQQNESLNSTIGAKNPKTRFYGGSESSDFQVACGVAQTNLGYSYTGKTLEGLHIEPGLYYDKHVKAMNKKANYDKERKKKNEFKSRRNHISRQKTSQTLRKEASEGVKYGSSIGLNLDVSSDKKAISQAAFDLPKISANELKNYEGIVPPYTPRPRKDVLMYDSKTSYHFIVFDTETTCTGKQAELCQLSAVTEDGKHDTLSMALQ